MKSFMTQRMRAAPVLTWAGFPGSTLAPQGLYFFSDVGVNGSFWYNNGASLKPIGPILLYRLLTPITTSNGIAEELFAISPKISKGVLSIGSQIDICFGLYKSGATENTTNTLKIGTNADGITGAASISSGLSLGSTARMLSYEMKHNVITDTTIQTNVVGGATSQPYATSTYTTGSTPRTISNVASNDIYISGTCTKTTGGIETVMCPFFDVWLR